MSTEGPEKPRGRVPGLEGYEDEAIELMKLTPDEIVRRWTAVQEIVDQNGTDSFSRTYRRVEDQVMDMNDDFGRKLLAAYMNANSAVARSHAPDLLELLPYVGYGEEAVVGFEQLADDVSPLVLETVRARIQRFLNVNPEKYGFEILLALIPALEKVHRRLG